MNYMEISEIIQSLEEKGYKIGRASQLKNYKEKRPLPLYLIDVHKYGNYANIYNEKQLCYLKVKIVPYKQRKKATICFNCSGYFHSARNCQMRPRCIKCNGQHAIRECRIKENSPILHALIVESKVIWRPGKAAKHYQPSKSPQPGKREKQILKQQQARARKKR
ncbi:hypothetical protein AVEN_81469-1 [Araneus ventricosus]|uniref:Pre-C2HC domain-containing protein n=1 Tax=Araneus ventricosus TaxID=182803 RepID=A0A4Y2E3U1_ARAVE|nr:hypothetical protein AVEN_81469-1 [Araneus ventricosus]